MASVLRNLFSRFGATKSAADAEVSAPASARVATGRVPVVVRNYDDEDEPADEPSFVRPRGASVRNFHCERDAERDEPAGPAPRFDVTAAGATHCGMRRSSNEDALLMLRSEAVYVVADGMGGHAGGEIASQLAVDTIASVFQEDDVHVGSAHAHVPLLAAELVQSIGAANEAVHSAASKSGKLSDMGTTVVIARFDANKGRLYVGHVGDSRCYRLRDGALKQITRDHTMSELGVKGREGGYLSRAVGPKVLVETDVAVIEPKPGDVYLLCTDGLTKMVPDAVIRGVLLDEETPATAASTLIGRANEAGGRDNVTALVIRIASPAGDRIRGADTSVA
jgi:protein phosphatase